MSTIDINSLMFGYDRSEANRIIGDFSAHMNTGLFYSIIGKNGCGKSTLLKNIARLVSDKYKRGEIIIDGKTTDEYTRRAMAEKLAYVGQREQAEFDFTAYELVLMGRTPHLGRFSSESRRDADIVLSAMKKTNCYELRDRNVSEISGGELQRVLIARSLAQSSAILLLDEPVSSLDIGQQLVIMDMLSGLCKTEKITILCVLHDISLASRYSDEILLMKDGALIAAGTPETVITEDNLMEAYGIRAEVAINSRTGRPYILHTYL